MQLLDPHVLCTIGSLHVIEWHLHYCKAPDGPNRRSRGMDQSRLKLFA